MPCNNRSHQIEIYVSASHPTSKPKMYLRNLASSPTSQQRVDGVRVALLERLHPPPYPPQRALHGEVDYVHAGVRECRAAASGTAPWAPSPAASLSRILTSTSSGTSARTSAILTPPCTTDSFGMLMENWS